MHFSSLDSDITSLFDSARILINHSVFPSRVSTSYVSIQSTEPRRGSPLRLFVRYVASTDSELEINFLPSPLLSRRLFPAVGGVLSFSLSFSVSFWSSPTYGILSVSSRRLAMYFPTVGRAGAPVRANRVWTALPEDTRQLCLSFSFSFSLSLLSDLFSHRSVRELSRSLHCTYLLSCIALKFKSKIFSSW